MLCSPSPRINEITLECKSIFTGLETLLSQVTHVHNYTPTCNYWVFIYLFIEVVQKCNPKGILDISHV